MFTGQIIIIGDSLPLPRSEPEIVKAHETYPALLNKEFGNVICIAYGAATSKNILSQASYFINNQENVYILHFGIVDCCPRSFTRFEAAVLRKLKIRLPEVIVKFIKSKRIVRRTNPKKFQQNCHRIKNLCLGNTYVLPIANPTIEFEKIAPGIKCSVRLYNSILKKIFHRSFINYEIDAKKHMMSDHHHLNQKGHKYIYTILTKKLGLDQYSKANQR